MISLRPYQQDLIDRTRAALKAGKRSPILVSPCGSGKTVMFSYFAQQVSSKGKRTLILAHRDELLDQISQTLTQFDVAHSFIAADREYRRASTVHVASVFSVVRRLDRIPVPDIIIIDESHHAIQGSTWSKVFAAFPKAWRIGVTATPTRLSGESLGDVFDEMVIGPTISELTQLGALCPYKIYVPSTISTAGLHSRGGDFAKNELAAAADKPTITGDAIREYKKHADGRRAIVFCVSIEHAKHVASQFAGAGYRAVCVDGTMDRGLRRDIVQSFRKGGTDVLTSCDLVSEGFDLPAIEVAIMLRPTQSLALWIQQSGRALRPAPGKDMAILLDHAGNTLRHGLPDEPREWSLEGRIQKKGTGEPDISVRICPKCCAALRIGVPACPHCGFMFAVKPRKIDHVDGELVEIDAIAIRRQRNVEQGRAQTVGDLIEIGKRRGYKNPFAWAKHVFNARQARKLAGKAA